MRKLSCTALEYIALAVALAACGNTAADDEAGKARIRVVHAAPDAGGVDIHIAGNLTPVISNLTYGEVTDYLELEPGTYNFQVRPTGRLDAPLYETGDITLETDSQITAVATGFVHSTGADDTLRILALKDQFADPASGSTRVRVVHAAADAPTVGIDVGNDNAAAPEIAGIPRFGDTGPAGVDLPADQALQIGIVAGEQAVTAFTTPPLPAGAQLYVIAAGRLAESPRSETGFALFAVGPDGLVDIVAQNPLVYALHASPDAPAVDLRSSGALLAGNLSYGQLGRIQVPPGDYPIDVTPAGSTTVVASGSVTGLTAGESYLAVAGGFVSPAADESGLRLIAVHDELADDADGARAQVIHASPDAPAVDISTVSGPHLDQPLLVAGLRFGQTTDGAGLAVPAANLALGIAQAGVPTPVATFGLATARGQRAFVVATGALSPTGAQRPFSLMVIDSSAQPWTVASIAPQ